MLIRTLSVFFLSCASLSASYATLGKRDFPEGQENIHPNMRVSDRGPSKKSRQLPLAANEADTELVQKNLSLLCSFFAITDYVKGYKIKENACVRGTILLHSDILMYAEWDELHTTMEETAALSCLKLFEECPFSKQKAKVHTHQLLGFFQRGFDNAFDETNPPCPTNIFLFLSALKNQLIFDFPQNMDLSKEAIFDCIFRKVFVETDNERQKFWRAGFSSNPKSLVDLIQPLYNLKKDKKDPVLFF